MTPPNSSPSTGIPPTAAGWSKTPNAMIDQHMADLKGSEFKVLMCVVRKTWGYGKRSDRISYSQFQEVTGLSRQAVASAIDALVNEHGLMGRREVAGPYEYGLTAKAVDTGGEGSGSQESRLEVVKKVDHEEGGSLKSRPPTSLKSRLGGSLKSRHTKESTTKERGKESAPARERPQTDAQALNPSSGQSPGDAEPSPPPDSGGAPSPDGLDLPSHAPSRQRVRDVADRIMLPEHEADKFFDHYAAESFEDRHGRPLRWQYKLKSWKRRWRAGTFDDGDGPRRTGGGGRPGGGGVKLNQRGNTG